MRFFRSSKVFITTAKENLAAAAGLYSIYQVEGAGAVVEALHDAEDVSLPMQIFVKMGSITRVMTVFSYTPIAAFENELYKLNGCRCFCTLNGKPLRYNTSFGDYGVKEFDTIFASPCLIGGMSGKPTQITYQDLDVTGISFAEAHTYNGEWSSYVSKQSLKCDLWKASQRLQKKLRQKEGAWEIQADETTKPNIRAFLDRHIDTDVLSLVEDLGLLVIQLVRSRSLVDSSMAIITFLKLRSGGSMIGNLADVLDVIIQDVAGPQIQADEDITDDILTKVTDFRAFIGNWESVKDSSVVKRAIKLFRYAAAVGVCAHVGIKLDKHTLESCKSEAGGMFAGPNFLCALLDTVALFLQRALMFLKTGKWETFFHGPTSYSQWFDGCQVLKRHHQFIGNLEAHGSSYHEFVRNLSASIEVGRSILKFGEHTSGYELTAIKRLLNEMLMIQASVLTYTAAQESRRPPFSLLVHGGSSVCKSTFVDMLFHYGGQKMNLPTTSDFKYTRNPSIDFWSGWNSSKWFIALDDVAYVNPDSAIQDLSLMEIIQLINDVPMVPNQAALEDKGKNPVRARMVVGTTNTKHLNAHAHFACPLAVQRRMPFVVTVQPKPEYARDDAPTMMDPLKLPPITDDWPDFWVISVDKVVPVGEDGRATFESIHVFSDVHRFLDWLGETMDLFHQVQTKARVGCAAMQGFKLCHTCNRVQCACPKLQNDESKIFKGYRMPVGFKVGESFKLLETEGNEQWVYTYEYDLQANHNYVLTTQIFSKKKLVREWTSVATLRGPSDEADEAEMPQLESEEIAMAEVLSQVVSHHSMQAGRGMTRAVTWCALKYIDWYMASATVRYITHSAMGWRVCRKLAMGTLSFVRTNKRSFYQYCGSMVRDAYIAPKWRKVLKGIAVASALAATVFTVVSIGRSFRKTETRACKRCYLPCCRKAEQWVEVCKACQAGKSKPVKTLEMCEDCNDVLSDAGLEEQGLRQSVADSTFKTTEKENVWKRDDYQTSSFDTTDVNVSYAALPRDQLMQLVQRNMARIKVSNGEKIREGNALCVGGHLWVTNNHTFYMDGDLKVSLLIEGTPMGATPNVTFVIRQHEIFRDPGSDQAWFMVMCWSPKRDLRQLIRKPTLAGMYRAAYTGYAKTIAPQELVVAAVQLGKVSHEGLAQDMDAWHGNAQLPTTVGDCGMPLVVHKPQSAILGLHMLGNASGTVWASALDSDKVERAVAHFDRPIIQSGSPVISAPSKEKSVGQLRMFSPLRWLEEGSVTVYGSYTGFQATPRSKVGPTLLGTRILEERKWDVDAVRPELRDWRPWRLALVDVANQQHGAIDSVKLRACAKAYVKDVLTALPVEALQTLQVLSNEAVVNGIAGVKFIDKMNFKSSMGEPYCKAKKHFLEGDINVKYFNPEVLDRIAHIETCYARGQRACPVFSGQLKDEPRSRAKVAAGKVRVFTGAPADWSFVVRKYLLTTVKVIQENPFVFEASPGCATQTLEWEQYFDYLTRHGVDRLIAGDYGKFDKKMAALLILEAFWILSEILREAGWTEEELIVIHCIAEDTAYSVVNFGGDLVEFFGSNPSGHPLTVIINCLVNALYMRYCYLELSPLKLKGYAQVENFKKHVNLLTYGDDNAMGVSPLASWFNHTAIQETLASIGVEYTMADKESESRPFIHIREVSYLKRTWRWDDDIGAVVCPLEVASIHKMLTVGTPSETESPEVHMASLITAAVNEWFWYGKETFERERAWLWNLALEAGIHHEVKAKSFPTWSELCARFEKSSLGMETQRTRGCVGEHPRTIVPK